VHVCVLQPYFGPSVGVKLNTPKVRNLESSGTPECLEFYSKAQNTSHWGVFGVIGKVLKSRYRKWPLQPKLWAKEGSEVKLTVWFPTTKSQESTRSRHALGECDTSLERSRQGLQDWLRPRTDPRLGRGVMAVQSPKSPTGTHSGQLRDSISGVLGKSDIRMPLPRTNTEYTVRNKVVAYSRVRAMVSLVCPSARGKSQHSRVSRMLN
jgi:hypothetical protein